MALLMTGPDLGTDAPSQTGLGTNLGTSLTARILAGLFAAGATLALLTLLLPDTNEHGAYIIAERMRCEVRDEFPLNALLERETERAVVTLGRS